ncbi:glycosyltransferase family 39 protein [Nitratireductor mangrovi]|uniref:Glycosyltransferase family 39 protein n=1 Tax=Nitratireductor mangrovi TaxID=2599600 RepID=A0A5B8KYL4_9HYPH|nr:glycosyltransferase family 39 protein [Nitratireductor mangrovi]QDZ00807.1 glycosyltransferase family 39 protein [Nitratireductor mangrovi]
MRYVILFLLCLLAVAPGISRFPAVDRDEARFVQASKQMVESGDYVDISFQEEKRYKKPVGVYWLHAAAIQLSGYGAEAPIWVYRLVSVLAIASAVLATCWAGAGLFGARAGFIAGLGLAATFAIAFEGRIAKTDAVLLAFTVVAQGALARIHLAVERGRPVGYLPWIFWIAQGCGILIKGPITPLASALTVLALFAFKRDWRWLRHLRPLRGLALAALIVLPWLALITWKSGAAFWQESLGKDLFGKVVGGQESHGLPPGFYVATYSLYLWPFGLLVLGAGLRAWNLARADTRLLFLLCWYVTFWLFFELIPTKLPNYMIPAYPALFLLLGWAMTRPDGEAATPLRLWQVWLWRLAAFGQIVVTVGIATAAIVLPASFVGNVSVVGIAAALCALLAGGLAFPTKLVLSLRRMAAACAVAWLSFALIFSFVLPSMTTMWLSPRIEEAFVAARPCEDSVLAAVRFHEPSLVFMMGTKTKLTDVNGAAAHLAADPACAIVLVPEDAAGEFSAFMASFGISTEATEPIVGINYSNGNRLSLRLYKTLR